MDKRKNKNKPHYFMKTQSDNILSMIYEQAPVINSGFNGLSQLILMVSSLIFLWFLVPKFSRKWVKNFAYLGCALTITASFFRFLVDAFYVITHHVASFVWYEALIALTRNFGIPIIITMSVFAAVEYYKIAVVLRAELKEKNSEIEELKDRVAAIDEMQILQK